MVQKEEIAGAFDLKGAIVCNDALVTGDDPVRIETPSQQWAYAAVFRLSDGLEHSCEGDEHLIIRVEVTVQVGRIGIAVAQPDLREFISSEPHSDAAAGRKTLELAIESVRPGICVVVRNVATNGTVSTVQIHTIKAYLGHGPCAKGCGIFDSIDAQAINDARLKHLASLDLSIEGKAVLDVGCGVGHLSGYFVEHGCRVTCVDSRPENLAHLETLYPGRKTHVADVQKDSLAELGNFDVVFCFGLIYHTENPIAALRNMASCCLELLLLETVVTDDPRPIFQLVEEPHTNNNQSVSGLGCRPSPAFIAMALSCIGFPFVYVPKTRPGFPDFHFERNHDSEWQRDGHLLRRVFVAARTQIDNPLLELAVEYDAPLESAKKSN